MYTASPNPTVPNHLVNPIKTTRNNIKMTNYTPTDRKTLPPLGFLAVECFFYRPSGDAFNSNTWAFPLIRELATGSKENVLVSKDDYNEAFLDSFVQAGKRLAERGAVGIITSCGFLAQAQPA